MKKISLIVTFVAVFTFLSGDVMFAGGPLDPIRADRWVVNAGIGPGTHYFGNGAGFGPALKGSFEKGMWDVGPGVVTLGGEMTFSFFSQNFGAGWHESWFNVLLGARGAYHYGWNVEGLDTYGGLPLGLGFCAHSFEDHPGSAGSTPVYPYAGIFFGASYFFTKDLGVNGEVGFNSTYANIGIVYRIK